MKKIVYGICVLLLCCVPIFSQGGDLDYPANFLKGMYYNDGTGNFMVFYENYITTMIDGEESVYLQKTITIKKTVKSPFEIILSGGPHYKLERIKSGHYNLYKMEGGEFVLMGLYYRIG